MEDLVGKKVKGFKFEGDYVPQMDRHIGEVGEIISINLKRSTVRVEFNKTSWKYPADQIEKHLVKELPKAFGCTNTNQKLWNKYIKWLNGGFAGDVNTYYGFDADGFKYSGNTKESFDTILSLEEWDEIVNETQTKTEETMKNYTITREQLKKIYDVACGGWKEKITEYAGRNPFGDTIEFTQTEVGEMFKAASLSQTAVLANIFGKQIHEIDLSTGGVDGKDLFNNNGELDHALICVRTYGNYKNKAFILNNDYDWELVKDNSNHLCLVPTRKK